MNAPVMEDTDDLEKIWRARCLRPVTGSHHPRRQVFSDRLAGRFFDDGSLDKATRKQLSRTAHAAALGVRPGTSSLAVRGTLPSLWSPSAASTSSLTTSAPRSRSEPRKTKAQTAGAAAKQREQVAKQIQSQRGWIERLEEELKQMAVTKARVRSSSSNASVGSLSLASKKSAANGGGNAGGKRHPLRAGEPAEALSVATDMAQQRVAAATRIQAQLRRHRAQEALKRQRKGAVRIQALARGHRTRQHHQHKPPPVISFTVQPTAAVTVPVAVGLGSVLSAPMSGAKALLLQPGSGKRETKSSGNSHAHAGILSPVSGAVYGAPSAAAAIGATSSASSSYATSLLPPEQRHSAAGAAAAAASGAGEKAAAAAPGVRNRIIATQRDAKEMDNAAVRIQSIARGKSARLRVQEEQRGAVAIQKVTRGARQRTRIADLRACKDSLFGRIQRLRETAERLGDTGAPSSAAHKRRSAAGLAVNDRASAVAGLLCMPGLARKPWGPLRGSYEALHELEDAVTAAAAAAAGEAEAELRAAELIPICVEVGRLLDELCALVGADASIVRRLQPSPFAAAAVAATAAQASAPAAAARSSSANGEAAAPPQVANARGDAALFTEQGVRAVGGNGYLSAVSVAAQRASATAIDNGHNAGGAGVLEPSIGANPPKHTEIGNGAAANEAGGVSTAAAAQGLAKSAPAAAAAATSGKLNNKPSAVVMTTATAEGKAAGAASPPGSPGGTTFRYSKVEKKDKVLVTLEDWDAPPLQAQHPKGKGKGKGKGRASADSPSSSLRDGSAVQSETTKAAAAAAAAAPAAPAVAATAPSSAAAAASTSGSGERRISLRLKSNVIVANADVVTATLPSEHDPHDIPPLATEKLDDGGSDWDSDSDSDEEKTPKGSQRSGSETAAASGAAGGSSQDDGQPQQERHASIASKEAELAAAALTSPVCELGCSAPAVHLPRGSFLDEIPIKVSVGKVRRVTLGEVKFVAALPKPPDAPNREIEKRPSMAGELMFTFQHLRRVDAADVHFAPAPAQGSPQRGSGEA